MLKKMSTWQLYIRHAHRDTSDRDLDNGISDKGHRQAKELVESLKTLKPALKLRKIFSSPKLRCWETAEYVAKWNHLKVEENKDLLEQKPGEPASAVKKRVLEFVGRAEMQSEVLFSSHGDILGLIAEHYGIGAEPKKGDFFLVEDGKVKIFNGVREGHGNPGK